MAFGVDDAIAMGASSFFGMLGAKNSASASEGAAAIQAQASMYGIDTMKQLSQQSLAFQQQQWAQAQENARPYVAYGRGAVEMLGDLMGVKPDYPATVANTTGGGQPANATRLPEPVIGQPGTQTNYQQYPRNGDPPVGAGPGNTRPGVGGPNPTSGRLSMSRPGTSPTTSNTTQPNRTMASMYSGGGQVPGDQTPGGMPRPSQSVSPGSGVQDNPPDNTPGNTTGDSSGQVTIQWPDGRQAKVPAYQLEQYKALGAEAV